MGVYEDLLRRKKIIEDEQGNITVNSVVDKNIRDKLTDNSVQTYKETQENNNRAISQMRSIMKRTTKSTIWEQMQNFMQNKPMTTSNLVNSFRNNFTNSISNRDNNKNTSLVDDAKGLLRLTGLGASTGSKQTLKYIESANENNFSNYKNLKNKQFLTSKNVSEEDKTTAKTQNNLLLQMNGIETDKNIETNLTKKAINNSIEKDNQKIQEEQSKMSNAVTQKLGEIAPSIGQMLPGTVASAVNPVLGTAYFTTSSGGSYIDEAKQRGMTDEQAFKYGTIMGTLEGASESIITGQQLSKVSKAFTGKEISKKVLESYGFNIFENAVQEAVMEPAQEITAGIIGDKADWSDMGKRMLQSGFNGALIGAISNGATYGLSKSGEVYNKIKNGESVTKTEYKQALQENIDTFGKNVVEQKIRDGATEVYQELNNAANLQQESTQTQQALPLENNIANNLETLYNNTNESESGINGQIQRGRMEELSGQYGTRLQQEAQQQKNRQYTKQEYEQWENSIAPTEESKLTNEQIKLKDEIKRQYNKDIVFFNDDNNYNAGSSLVDGNKIYINSKQAETFGMNKVIFHEIAESNILHNREISNDIIQPAIEKIINDEQFEKQKQEFWKSESEIIPSDYAIAKDILCDRFAETKSGEKLDYDNVLSQETNMTIDYALENFNKELNNANIPILKNMQDTTLPIQETSKVRFNNDNLIQESNKMSDEETAQILTEIKGRTNEKRKMSAFLKANLIDKGMVFEELSRKTGNRDLQGKYDYTLTAEARGQNAIGNARYDYQATVENGKIKKGDENAKQISKSLTDIIDEVGEDPTNFYNYMYHQLNIDRMTLEERFGGDTGINYQRKNAIKNKPVFGKGVTAEISKKYVQELEQKHPEFKEYAQDVYDFLDANTKELVDNGVISKETQQLFKEMYPHYVPISRVTNKGQAINVPLDTGRTGVNSPIKRAKGGNRDINPLFQTMADRTLQTYRASARNNFGIELKNTLDKAKQLNQITELTDIDSIMESMTDEEQNNNLLQEGVNGGNPTFTVFENGEKVTYEISKDMYDALKPKNELLKRFDNSALSKVLNKVNNFRRGLLTEYNPVFSITNALKDVQDVLLYSQHSAKTYSKIPEATAQIVSKGYWYKEYIQNGGEQNSYFRDGEFDATKKLCLLKLKKL